MNVIDLLNTYLDSDDTCDEIDRHFKAGNDPVGDYWKLGYYFMDENYSDSIETSDKCYKHWLKDLINEGKEDESFALSVLKKKYPTKELLENYVFNLNGIDPKLNQKWHYFISYWGYRDYITKHPEVPHDENLIKVLPGGTYAWSANPFNKKCTEGQIWFAHVSKNKKV